MATAYNLDDPWTQAKRRFGASSLSDTVPGTPPGTDPPPNPGTGPVPPFQPPQPGTDPQGGPLSGPPPGPVPPFQPPPPGTDPQARPTPPTGPAPPIRPPGTDPAAQPYQDALGQAPLTPAGPTPAAPVAPAPYDAHLSAIASAPDPASASVAQDHLGWQLHQDLTADGHAVTWKNGNLVVDGKEYAVGDGTQPAGAVPAAAPAPAAPAAAEAYNPASWTAGAGTGSMGRAGAMTGAMTGGAATSSAPPPDGTSPPNNTPANPPNNTAPGPDTNAAPQEEVAKAYQELLGRPMKPEEYQNWAGNANFRAEIAASPEAKAYAASHGGGSGGTAPTGGNLKDPAYVDSLIAYWSQQPGVNPSVKNDPGYWRGKILSGALGTDQQFITDRFMQAEGAPAGSGGGNIPGWPPSSFDSSSFNASTGGNEAQAAGLYDWSPSAPDYVPGQIGTQVNFDGMDPQLAASLKDLLAHPTALDDRTVEMMKAQSAEESAAAAQAQDEDLKTFGNAHGIGDSPWLAAARGQNQWDRRSATIASNRNVDLTAAQTRMADKRASINLVMDSVLKSSAESRNRFDLNEQLKQAATKLGLQKDQLVSQYILGSMDDLTKRHGIDLGFKIDAAKLAQSSDQFKQDLLFRIAQLRQQDEQFGATYGLQLTDRQQQADRDAWAKTKDVYLGGGA